MEQFKARLMAERYAQLFRMDYFETVFPVVRYSGRMIMAIAVEYGLFVHQMDVVFAYINSELSEEIYIKHLEGLFRSSNPEKVLRLKKFLFGLKQSLLHLGDWALLS